MHLEARGMRTIFNTTLILTPMLYEERSPDAFSGHGDMKTRCAS
jgi:hypothetical protein